MNRQKAPGHKLFFRRYILKKTHYIVFLTFLHILGLSFTLVMPYVYMTFIDDVFTSGDISSFQNVVYLTLISYLLSTFSGYAVSVFSLKISNVLFHEVSVDLYHKVLAADYHAIEQYSAGDILNRIGSNVSSVISIYIEQIPTVITQICSIVIPVYIMIQLDAFLTLLLILPILCISVITIYYGKKTQDYQYKVFDLASSRNSYLYEILNLMPIIKLNNAYQWATSRYSTIIGNFISNNWKVSMFSIKNQLINSLCYSFLPVCIFLVGGNMVISGTMSLGSLIAYISYLGIMFSPIGQLSSMWLQYKSARTATERIEEIMYLPEEQSGTLPVSNTASSLYIKSVSFSHGESHIFNDLNMTFSPGLNIVIGDNGCGKTTMVKLVSMLYHCEEGGIFYDKNNVSEYDLEKYRDSISIVLKDSMIISATILENFQFIKPEVTPDEIHRLSRTVGFGEFLDSFPDGLNTNIGDKGILPSSGEKQKIELLRALLKHPKILIIDEGLSSVDIPSKSAFLKWISTQNDLITVLISHEQDLDIHVDACQIISFHDCVHQ